MPDDIKNMFNSRFNVENIDKINTKNAERYNSSFLKEAQNIFRLKPDI